VQRQFAGLSAKRIAFTQKVYAKIAAASRTSCARRRNESQ
jgi:hypothetical protein